MTNMNVIKDYLEIFEIQFSLFKLMSITGKNSTDPELKCLIITITSWNSSEVNLDRFNPSELGCSRNNTSSTY